MKSLLLPLLLLLVLPASAAEYYLWQRKWTAAVRAAAQQPCDGLQVFAAELSAKRTERSEAPPELWKREDVTAVFRLRVDALNSGGFARLAAEIARNGCANIQLDADVPERRLAEYAGHLKALRAALPPQVREFSVTALPCHLAHADFAAVAAQTDYYVLQLHGLDVPARIDEPYALIDGTVARTAIRRARQFKMPFRLALPSYAYRLEFDAAGKSAMAGFITKEDELGTLTTPFGKVQLIRLVGVTEAEIEKMKNRELTPAQLGEQLKDGLTDYNRK